MKKLIILLLVLLGYMQDAISQSCNCASISNFTSACKSTAKGRQFLVSLTVTANPGDSAEIVCSNGNINGVTSIKQKLNNQTTDFQFTYNESVVSSTFNYTINIKSGSRVICTVERKLDVLADCGNDCGASWANISTPSQCTHIDGVSKLNNKDTMLGIHGNLNAGPGKVTSYTTTVTDVQRRQLCTGQPAGAWQSALSSMPIVTTAEMGGNYATGITATTVNGTGFNSTADFFLYLKLPSLRITPRQPCSEEFKINLSITLTFDNGCKKTINHSVSYIWK